MVRDHGQKLSAAIQRIQSAYQISIKRGRISAWWFSAAMRRRLVARFPRISTARRHSVRKERWPLAVNPASIPTPRQASLMRETIAGMK